MINTMVSGLKVIIGLLCPTHSRCIYSCFVITQAKCFFSLSWLKEGNSKKAPNEHPTVKQHKKTIILYLLLNILQQQNTLNFNVYYHFGIIFSDYAIFKCQFAIYCFFTLFLRRYFPRAWCLINVCWIPFLRETFNVKQLSKLHSNYLL